MKVIQDKEKPNMKEFQKEVRCPVHNCLLGRYDCRTGISNATFYCSKCGIEYTFTIPSDKKRLTK